MSGFSGETSKQLILQGQLNEVEQLKLPLWKVLFLLLSWSASINLHTLPSLSLLLLWWIYFYYELLLETNNRTGNISISQSGCEWYAEIIIIIINNIIITISWMFRRRIVCNAIQGWEWEDDTLLVTPCGVMWLSGTHSIISVTISAMWIICDLICNWSRDAHFGTINTLQWVKEWELCHKIHSIVIGVGYV